MTGARILLRRAQSPMRRARRMAAVMNVSLEEDWTALEDICPLPNYAFANKHKTDVRKRRILKHDGDSLIRKYFEANPKKAKDPINMLEHRAIPIRTKVILDADPDAASKTYPFTSRADLERQIVEDGDATAVPRSRSNGALRKIQEAEEIILRRALRDFRDQAKSADDGGK